jgi:hypothetical protein
MVKQLFEGIMSAVAGRVKTATKNFSQDTGVAGPTFMRGISHLGRGSSNNRAATPSNKLNIH